MSGKFERYTDTAGEYRFRLKAGNGENILASEGYKAMQGCDNGINSVKENAPDDSKYDRKETSVGKYMFNLKAGNGEIIGTSQSYTSASGRDTGIESVKNNAPNAETVDMK